MNYYKLLMEKPPNSRLDIPGGNYLPVADRLEKQNKNHKFQITHSDFYFKHLPTFLFTFASTLSKFFFAH